MTAPAKKTQLSPLNLAIGAGVSLFEVSVSLVPPCPLPALSHCKTLVADRAVPILPTSTTLGQPLEGESSRLPRPSHETPFPRISLSSLVKMLTLTFTLVHSFV